MTQTSQDPQVFFQQLAVKVLTYLPFLDQTRFKKAFDFAYQAHRYQVRDSGELFVMHPLTVAWIVADYQVDENTLIAALLHDTVEDVENISLKDIEQNFGQEVTNIVDGLTKVKKVIEEQKEKNRLEMKKESSIETIRKILQKSQNDLRVIIIKMADRVHNLQTLKSKKKIASRKKKAKESLKIFVKIADRLGVFKLKKELSDLAFPYAFPDEFKRITTFLDITAEEKNVIKQEVFNKIKASDVSHLVKNIINHDKRLIALNDVLIQKKKLSINDNLNFIIITKDKNSCYEVISLINKIWTTVSQERDYIASPKDNGYQAYMLKMMTEKGNLIDFQIMSEEMQKKNYLGVLVDFFQNESGGTLDIFKIFAEIDQNTRGDAFGFYEAAQTDLLSDKIKIANNGKYFYIPQNSTALDFVFFVFKEKAGYTQKILCNEEEIPCSKLLMNNDSVEIILGNQLQINFNWFNLVNTFKSRTFIQRALQRKNRHKKILIGKKVLQREFDIYQRGSISKFLEKSKNKEKVREQFGMTNIDDLFVLISEWRLRPYEVFRVLFSKTERRDKFIFKGLIRNVNRFLERVFLDEWPKKQAKFKVEGLLEKRNEVIDSLNRLALQFNIEINSTYCKQVNNFFVLTVDVTHTERRSLRDFVVKLENKPGIFQMMPMLSNRKQLVFYSYILLTGILLFVLPLVANLFSGISFLAMYLSFLPLAITSFLFSNFISNYFSQLRNTIWISIVYFSLSGFSFAFLLFILIKNQQFKMGLPIVFWLFLIIWLIVLMKNISEWYSKEVTTKNMLKDQDWSDLRKQKILGYTYRLTAVTIFAIVPVIAKMYLQGVDSMAVSALSFFSAFLFILPFILYRNIRAKVSMKEFLEKNKKGYSKSFVISLVFSAINIFFFFLSLKYTTAVNLRLFSNFWPVLAIIFALLFYRDKVVYLQQKKDIQKIIFMFILGTIGTSIIVLNKGGLDTSTYQSKLLGDWLAFLAMLFNVLHATVLITYAKTKNAFRGSDFAFNKAFLISLAYSPLIVYYLMTITLTMEEVMAILAMGVLGIAGGQYLTYKAYQKIDGFISYLLFNLAPLMTLVLEVVFLDLSINYFFILGGLLILGTSIGAEYINTQSEKRMLLQKK